MASATNPTDELYTTIFLPIPSAGIQGYRDTRIQGYRDTWIQGYKDTRIQGYKDTGIQGYKDTDCTVAGKALRAAGILFP